MNIQSELMEEIRGMYDVEFAVLSTENEFLVMRISDVSLKECRSGS